MSTKAPQALTFPSLSDSGREAVYSQAKVAGHAAGYAEGLAQARKLSAKQLATDADIFQQDRAAALTVLKQQVTGLTAASDALHMRAAPVISSIESQLLDGAFEIAEALLGQELTTGTAGARAALARALRSSAGDQPHTVRLNPEDLTALAHEVSKLPAVTFIADASLVRGDALADYKSGYLDARLSAAIKRAREALGAGAQ